MFTITSTRIVGLIAVVCAAVVRRRLRRADDRTARKPLEEHRPRTPMESRGMT